jgi:hypothetical protein
MFNENKIVYSKRFSWKQILARKDCPKENVGNWLEEQVLDEAWSKEVFACWAYSNFSFDKNGDVEFVTVHCTTT